MKIRERKCTLIVYIFKIIIYENQNKLTNKTVGTYNIDTKVRVMFIIRNICGIKNA